MTKDIALDTRNIGKFRYFCQKVLPAVYDDSLSYYELLNKVVQYLNNVIEAVNINSDAIKELQDIISGELDDYIVEKINEWFEEHEPELMKLLNNVAIDNEYFNSNKYTDVKIQEFDGFPYLVLNMDISGNTLDNQFLHGVSLRDVFETNNLIEIDANSAQWDSGTATLQNANIVQTNIGYGFHFICTENESIVTFPARTFNPEHKYVYAGVYRTEHYDQGYYGIRGTWRKFFDPFPSAKFKNYCYYMASAKAGLFDDAYEQIGGQGNPVVNIYGGFNYPPSQDAEYEEDKDIKPILEFTLINPITVDMTDIYGNGNEPTSEEVEKAFSMYIAIKAGKETTPLAVKVNNFYEEQLNTDYYRDVTARKIFRNLMRMTAFNLNMDYWNEWYTPSGYPANNTVQTATGINAGNLTDAMKLALYAFSNETLNNIMSQWATPMASYGKYYMTKAGKAPFYGNNYNPFIETKMTFISNVYKWGYTDQSPTIKPTTVAADPLIGKGGSLGASNNPLPWDQSFVPNRHIFENELMLFEISNGRTLCTATIGDTGYYSQPGLSWGVKRWFDVSELLGYPLTLQQMQDYWDENQSETDPTKKLPVECEWVLKSCKGERPNDTPESYQLASVGAFLVPSRLGARRGLSKANLFRDDLTPATTLDNLHSLIINPDYKYPLASISKLMTCTIAIESGMNLSDLHAIKESDIIPGSGNFLHPGMILSLRDLIYIAMAESDNDACEAIARIVGNYYIERGIESVTIPCE